MKLRRPVPKEGVPDVRGLKWSTIHQGSEQKTTGDQSSEGEKKAERKKKAVISGE